MLLNTATYELDAARCYKLMNMGTSHAIRPASQTPNPLLEPEKLNSEKGCGGSGTGNRRERERERERERREEREGGEERVESEGEGSGGRETDAEANIDSIGEIR